MTTKDPGAPCPPIEEPYETEKEDNRLANETDADYSAEETNAKEVPTA